MSHTFSPSRRSSLNTVEMEDEAIAALLHDAIEDQGGPKTRDEILRRFGERVTGIVEGCTDSQTIPKPPWKERKLAYIAELATSRRRSNSSAPPTSSQCAQHSQRLPDSGRGSLAALRGWQGRDALVLRGGGASTHPVRSDAACGRIGAGRRRNRGGSRASNFAPLVWTGRIGENRGCSRGRRGARGDGPSRPLLGHPAREAGGLRGA